MPDIAVGRAFGAALFGIEAVPVEVQVAQGKGLPRAAIVGQAESEVKEGKERLKVALQGAGLWFRSDEPGLIINLAPADVVKTGTGLDLAMCLGVAAIVQPNLAPPLAAVLCYGEVGLDGRLRGARGTLSVAMAAKAHGFRALLVAPESAREAAQVTAHGDLFLDELPEFPRMVLEYLRQPLEDGQVAIVRAAGRALFPARFRLAGAMNPCPCRWRGCPARECRCSPAAVAKYQGRLSGPLLNRIDLHVEVPAVAAVDLARSSPGEASAAVHA
jgi:predicted ATPase with chaperone activity